MSYVQKPHKISPYDAVEYKNGKHTLKPGDAAIAVTTCTSRGQLRVGRYLGVRNGGVVMEVHDTRTLLVDKDDVPYDWSAENRECPSPWNTAPKHPPYHLRYNSPEYIEAQAKYKKDYQEWKDTVYAEHEAKIAARKVGYSNKEFPYTWITNLQNNNIYPAGIALVDVTL